MADLPLEQRIRQLLSHAIEFEGICFRNVSQRFANRQDILLAKGSKITGGRFNFKGTFEVLYLSCDVHTCIEETTHAARSSGFDVAKMLPRTTVGVKVRLSRVLDFTRIGILRQIGISKSVLAGTDWERIQNVENKEAVTQSIGRFAKQVGFEAILVPSAVWRGKNLDIFPDNVLPSSEIHVTNLLIFK